VRWVNYLAKTPSAWVNSLAAGWVNYLATKGLKRVNCLAVDKLRGLQKRQRMPRTIFPFSK